MTRIAN